METPNISNDDDSKLNHDSHNNHNKLNDNGTIATNKATRRSCARTGLRSSGQNSSDDTNSNTLLLLLLLLLIIIIIQLILLLLLLVIKLILLIIHMYTNVYTATNNTNRRPARTFCAHRVVLAAESEAFIYLTVH